MGSLGTDINKLLAPVGIRPFSGGPYPDRGQGDAALAASKPLQTSGQELLSSGTNALASIFAQIAGTAGVNNPFASQTGSTSTGTTGFQDPYGMSASQMAEYNTQAGQINAQRQAALDNFKSSSASRGLSSSSAKATEQYINSLADTQLNETFSKAATAAQQAKMQGLVQLLSGAQSDISQGGNLINSNVGTLQNSAQAATAATNQGNADFMAALTAALTGTGVIKTNAGTTPTTANTTKPTISDPGIDPGNEVGRAAGVTPSYSGATPGEIALILGGLFGNQSGLAGTGVGGFNPQRNPQAQYNNPDQVGG